MNCYVDRMELTYIFENCKSH